MQLALVLTLIFAVAIALFAVQNTTPVALNFLSFRVEELALSLLVLMAATLGAALTFALGLVREVQHRSALRGLREEARSHERKTQQLADQLKQQGLAPPERPPSVDVERTEPASRNPTAPTREYPGPDA